MSRFWINLAFYQATWFASVIGAGRGLWWAGLVPLALFALWQLGESATRERDLRLIAVALGLGLVIDSVLAGGRLAAFAAPVPSTNLAPVWILTLWAAFALTLNHSLAALQTHPWLAAALGALGAPLAYLGAERGFHAVAFAAPQWRGLAILGLAWALVLPVLLQLARRWSTPEAQA